MANLSKWNCFSSLIVGACIPIIYDLFKYFMNNKLSEKTLSVKIFTYIIHD